MKPRARSRRRLLATAACLALASGAALPGALPDGPNGWAASAGGFPAMTGNVPFLMKDVVLLAVSVYLLKQDVVRVSRSTGERANPSTSRPSAMVGSPHTHRRTV